MRYSLTMSRVVSGLSAHAIIRADFGIFPCRISQLQHRFSLNSNAYSKCGASECHRVK